VEGKITVIINRKTSVLLLLFACIVIALQPMALTATTYWDVSTDWSFYSGTGSNSGPVTFGSPFTTTQIQIDGGLVTFSYFNMGTLWTSIGFHAPQGATMDVTQVTTDEVIYDIDPGSGMKKWSLYVASKGAPNTVTGGVSWTYYTGNQTLAVECNYADTITASWAAAVIPPIVNIPSGGSSLINTWLRTGDVSGLFIAMFTSEMGSLFYLFVLIMVSIPIFQAYGAIATSIIWVLVWGTVSVAVPAVALDIGLILLGLSVGFLIFSVYMGRRGLG